MTNAKPKPGVPVLAYLASEAEPELLSLSCRICIHKDKRDLDQVTIALQIAATLKDAAEEQTLIVQYDADNLHSVMLDKVTFPTPSDLLNTIARNTALDKRTLNLQLKQSASIWCPRGLMRAPQANDDSKATFTQIARLVNATALHLVIDYKWLEPDQKVTIRQLARGKRKFVGYSLNKFYAKGWELKDWTDFAPAVAPEPLGKRARPVSSSSSSPPTAKRVGFDDSYDPPSPTEAASTPPRFANADYEYDYQTKAIANVVRRELPEIFETALPTLIAKVLQQEMPRLAPNLFANPPFTSTFDSDASFHPPANLTRTGNALMPHVVHHLKQQLENIEVRALSITREQREAAHNKFEEMVEDSTLELKGIIEEGKQDLENEKGNKLDNLRHDLEKEGEDLAIEVSEQVSRKADGIVEGTMRRLNEIDRNALAQVVQQEVARQLQQPNRVRYLAKSKLKGTSKGKGGFRAVARRHRTSIVLLDSWKASHRSANGKLSRLLGQKRVSTVMSGTWSTANAEARPAQGDA